MILLPNRQQDFYFAYAAGAEPGARQLVGRVGTMNLDFDSAFTERTPRIVNAAKLHRAANRKKAKQFLIEGENAVDAAVSTGCLLYTSPSPRDRQKSRMPSSA